jgi:hypothetical protein
MRSGFSSTSRPDDVRLRRALAFSPAVVVGVAGVRTVAHRFTAMALTLAACASCAVGALASSPAGSAASSLPNGELAQVLRLQRHSSVRDAGSETQPGQPAGTPALQSRASTTAKVKAIGVNPCGLRFLRRLRRRVRSSIRGRGVLRRLTQIYADEGEP